MAALLALKYGIYAALIGLFVWAILAYRGQQRAGTIHAGKTLVFVSVILTTSIVFLLSVLR